MGAGKTKAKGEYIMELIMQTPWLRTLDVDCNRLYSLSNAASLEKVAVALRDKGPEYKGVTAVGPHGQRGGGGLVCGRRKLLLPTLPQAHAGLGCAL